MINFKAYWNELERILRDSRMQYIATSLSYTTVLSLVPLVAISLSFAKGLGALNTLMGKVEPALMTYLSAAAGEVAITWLEDSIARINSGALGALGYVTLLIIATKLLSDIDSAIQILWGTRKNRSIFKRVFFYWLTIFLGPAVLATVVAITSSSFFQLFSFMPATITSWLLLTLFTAWIFNGVPNRKIRWWTSFASAGLTSVALLVSQVIFGWAAQNLLYYNKVYGSLTSIFLFFVWILIIWYIGLFGVALNAMLEKQKIRKVTLSV